MHDDEVMTDPALARRLVAAQFPQWAGLDVARVRADGTDNAMYRLGEDLVLRLPRRPAEVSGIDKELAWLPRLGPELPLPVPTPLARGEPGEGFPWPWSVCRWLAGDNPTAGRVGDVVRLARDLAGFIQALQALDATGAPRAGEETNGRGAPLARWRGTIGERLAWLSDLDDIAAVTAAWEADAAAPPWDRAPVWLHGDLSVGNLLVWGGALCGVIDWTCLGAGDPACELQVAWTLFERDGRDAFRQAMAVDEATWIRGRAWGLAIGVLNLSYYRTRSPALAEAGRRTIDAVLADVADPPEG